MGEHNPSGGLADFLRRHQGEILAGWEHAAGRLAVTRALSRPALLDQIPPLLERIVDMADAFARGGALDMARQDAERHALDRLKEGFDLREVVTELALLRDSILQVMEQRAPHGQQGELRLVDRAIDRAIAASVDRYTEARDRTLNALDGASTAALEARSVEELCRRLLQVLIEAAPAIDTAAIMVREGDVLRTTAAIGLEDEVVSGFTLRVGEGFAGTVAERRAPLELRSAATDPLVRSDVVRARKLRALYGVPLLQADAVIGVAHMGSLTAYEFSEQDKRLFRSLAARATTGIYQCLLRAVAEQRALELAQAEARFRATFENAAAGIAVVALDGTFLHVNRRYCEILGYPSDELRGRHFQEFTHPDDIAPDLRIPHELLVTELGFTREKRYIRKDGSLAWVGLAVSTVRSPDGVPEYNIAVVHDITERKRMEHDLAASSGRLEAALHDARQAMRMREDVLAIVSHDLRSPLSAIHLAAQNLMGRIGEGADDKVRRQLSAIVRSADRMERLISDLLDVASIEAGRLSVDCAPHDAVAIVLDAVEQHRELARERGIALAANCSTAGVRVICDRERIMQVFGNLLGNALKFCRPGDRVDVGCEREDEHLRFSVADTGPGIPPQELPHVFEPYWSSRPSRASGTGLGLYISRAIIDAHGGRVWADSTPGAGTSVCFTLKSG